MLDDIRASKLDPDGALAVAVIVALAFCLAATLLPQEDLFPLVWGWSFQPLFLATLLVVEAAAVLVWLFLRRRARLAVRRRKPRPSEVRAGLDQTPAIEVTPDLRVHPGIYITKPSVAADLPGLVIVVFFVFGAINLFMPRETAGALFLLFLLVASLAAFVYVASERYDRKRAAQALTALHRLNDPTSEEPCGLPAEPENSSTSSSDVSRANPTDGA
jgi:hypothetical protein